MSLLDKIERIARIIRVVYIRKMIHLARKIKLIGFQGISLWEIIFFFLSDVDHGRYAWCLCINNRPECDEWFR